MSETRIILHFITPLKNVSPFDVNMAADAGFEVIVPYSDVDLRRSPAWSRTRSSRAHPRTVSARPC